MVDLLVDEGFEVRVIDNLVGGREANIAHHSNGLSLRNGAISAPLAARRCALSDAKYVFHFAGIGDIVLSIEHPAEYISANVLGTANVLERPAVLEALKSLSMQHPLRAKGWRIRHQRRSFDRPKISLCTLQISGRASRISLA